MQPGSLNPAASAQRRPFPPPPVRHPASGDPPV